MNVHEIPMVLFTLVSQMAVGAFVTLGAIHFAVRRHANASEADRVVAPAMYAIGPVLVVGLIVSIFHLNDVFHIFNVFRHWQTSWLSREIIFGLAFAAAGFTFAVLEWFKKGTSVLRQGVAALTAALGLLLLWAESMVYYSLEAVPAWHTWVVPFMFVATAILLGVLAVGSAMMVTTVVRGRAAPDAPAEVDSEANAGFVAGVRSRIREINAPSSESEWHLTTGILKWIALIGAATAVSIIIVTTIYVGDLSQGGATALESAAVLSGATMWWRLLLTGATVILLGFSVYRLATTTQLAAPRALVAVVLVTMVLALSGEFLGRLLHYEAMVRVGL